MAHSRPRQKLRAHWTISLVISAAMVAASCDAEHSPIGREALVLRTRTAPTAGTEDDWMFRQLSPQAAAAAWQIESDWDWERYKAWILAELDREFDVMATGPGQLRFTRRRGDYVEVLRLQLVAQSPRLRIRITFRASAT